MKIFKNFMVLLCLIFGLSAFAAQYEVLVLPVDIFNICDNYYSFDEPSEIIANDVIQYFNKTGKISSKSLDSVRNELSNNPQIKNTVSYALNKYKNNDQIDFQALKKISQTFDTKSILLISSSVGKRSAWEILEISSVFGAVNAYSLETKAVLLDNVNDVVMWSGKYSKNLANNELKFHANNTSQAVSQLEKIRFYSNDIVSKNICQNIIQRFMPKHLPQIVPVQKSETSDFKPNSLEHIKIQTPADDFEINSEPMYSF